MLEALPQDDQRYEIIEGDLLVTPAPSRSHQRAVGLLLTLLHAYLRAWHDVEVLTSPSAIRCGDRTLVQPDVFVLPIERGRAAMEWPALSALLLAIEVLSPETARADRHEKRWLYQRERVAVYWVVDPVSQVVERWRPGEGRPEILTHSVEWRPRGTDGSLIVNLTELFDEV